MVAVKQFVTNKSEKDFKYEVDKLDFIKKSLRKQACVMSHRAALAHGQNFMIILPLAKNFNLEVFLQEGKAQFDDDTTTKYDFGSRFEHMRSDVDRHQAILKQLYQLADALSWLHNGSGNITKPNCYMAHMDFKPENILIHGRPSEKATPVGTWMVTDFGISTFYKDSNKPSQEEETIRGVTSRLTSSDYSERAWGPYQSPEVAHEQAKERKQPVLRYKRNLDYSKCDVWSFGCVLSDVLAFMISKSRGVNDIREARDDGRDDNFYTSTAISPRPGADVNSKKTQIKDQVQHWKNELNRIYRTSWVPKYLDIVFNQSVLVCPPDRQNMDRIRDDLGQIWNTLCHNTYQGLYPVIVSHRSPEVVSTSQRLGVSTQVRQNPPITVMQTTPHQSESSEEISS